jgi:phosphate uptake regulator
MNSVPLEGETRKLQLTGGSTYIVSLPKEWVQQMGLERGSLVNITKAGKQALQIQPTGVEKPEKAKKAVVTVSEGDTRDSVVRSVVSVYLLGYNIIQMRVEEGRMDSEYKYAVKSFTRKKLIGTEILSDLPQELTLQVLLSYSDLSVKDVLRRMGIIASSMHSEAIHSIESDDDRYAKEIISMDDEVDRFSFYIIRLLKVAVSYTAFLRESGLKSQRECLGYRLITKSVERMADHAVKIAENSLSLTKVNLSNAIIEEIQTLSRLAISVFEDALESLFEEDYRAADKILERVEVVRRMEESIVQMIIKEALPKDVPALRLMVESIIRTAEYGGDIAEVVLNMTIRGIIHEE